ncbi:MAG: hypothetical protein AAGH64_11520, partial [Planctomycetota bacterium]
MSATPLPTTHLVLMGLRACGKSTLARTIGARMSVPAHDLDPMVLARMGAASVREAWERDGGRRPPAESEDRRSFAGDRLAECLGLRSAERRLAVAFPRFAHARCAHAREGFIAS